MTLTQTASLTKRSLLFLVVIFAVGIFSWVGYRYYYYNIYLPSRPPVEEKPDVKFGKLPKLDLPEASSSATNYTFVLDTTTGELPDKLPKIMKVYFIPERSISLLDPDRANTLAKKLLFPIGPAVISSTQFKYKDVNGGEMILDLNSSNFRFRHQSSFKPEGNVGNLPAATELETEFKQFLKERNLIKPQISEGKVKAVYDKGLLKNSTTATVSIWPNNIDDYPIVTPGFNTALIREIVTSSQQEIEKISEFTYIYWEVDKQTFATYPIKPVTTAYKELKENAGSIIFAPQNQPQISLRNIYLAYFQSEKYAPYLQPIYVFEGSDFVAYVPAVTSEFRD